MKILVINDIHAASVAPQSARADYVEDVFNLLEEVRQVIEDHYIDAVVLTGDIFHRKSNVPYWLVHRLMKIFNSWRCDKIAIVGNHDLSEKGLESITTQPIGVLFESGTLEFLAKDRLYRPKGRACDDIFCELGCRGGKNGGKHRERVTIHFSPANWFDGIDNTPDYLGVIRSPAADWCIKVAHATLMPDKEDYPFEAISYSDVPTDGLDLLLYGHIHNNVGRQTVNGTVFANYGSLGRVARTSYNDRSVELLMVELTKDEMKFEVIPLKSGLTYDELYLPKKEELDTEPMEAFAKAMGNVLQLEETSLDDALKSTGHIEPRVLTVVKKHLTEAGY